MKAGAMEGRREPALVSVGGSYVWNWCGSAWDGWWEAPTAPFWGSGSARSSPARERGSCRLLVQSHIFSSVLLGFHGVAIPLQVPGLAQ